MGPAPNIENNYVSALIQSFYHNLQYTLAPKPLPRLAKNYALVWFC